MSKPVLLSGREDVRALDAIFKAMEHMGHDATVRVLRFYVASQGIRWEHLYPEAKAAG